MKKPLSILFLALIAQFSIFATNHIINTQGMTFSPSALTISMGDSVTFNNTGGYHNVNGTQATYPNNPASFSNPTGVSAGWSYVYVFTSSGIYNYQCDPHLPGMVGTITVTDCNGIVNGTALIDTCGVCHQAYIYNFITHQVNFVDNANNLIAGVDYNPSTETVVFANDSINPYWNNCASNTIYDIVSNSNDHTILKTAIDACSLDGVLAGPGPFTLFAPTDAAFNNLPAGTVTALLNDIPALTQILQHHVVGDSVMSTMLSNNQIVTTLLGTNITVTITANGVYIDNAMVTMVDLVADNGVVHVIDAVLIPSASSNSIYDIVSNSSSHTILKTAIDACSLDGVLAGSGPFTLFAPTDAAFNALPAGTITALLNDIPQLTDILKHHVVADSVMSTMLSNNQVVTTLLGADVTVTISNGMVYIDNAMVIFADLVADNGVVHVIDVVLLPNNTSIIDNTIMIESNRYLYSVNILGDRVSKYIRDQIIFDIYKDGSVIKRFNR